MTKEDKQLLLIDLSTRLLYGVKIRIGEHSDYTLYGIVPSQEHPIIVSLIENEIEHHIKVSIKDIKPYLRPMSSMTEEERQELIKEFWGSHTILDSIEEVNWYLKKHFDIRGLIEKGLALPAPTDMYNVK